MNEQQIESFFVEVGEIFQFLELDYNYQRLDEYIKHPNDWRDIVAQSRYVSTSVGVEVWWYLADAAIGVAFVELQQPGVFPASVSFYPQLNSLVPKAINLSTLAEMQGVLNDPDFLLSDVDNTRKYKKRVKLIENNRRDIVVGLARAVQRYAHAILKGDITMFPEVMNYYQAKHKQLS